MTRDDSKIDDGNDVTLSLFMSKILNATDQMKQKKRKTRSKYNL